MTPEEIDAMPAGRAMDALIAEKVMGWTVCRADWVPAGLQYYQSPEAIIADAWEPSIDMAAAWQVVEALRVRLIYYDAHYKQGHHYWRFITPEWSMPVFSVAAHAPLAICRAALKAVLAPA